MFSFHKFGEKSVPPRVPRSANSLPQKTVKKRDWRQKKYSIKNPVTIEATGFFMVETTELESVTPCV